MRIRIVANATDYDTRKSIHQPCSLHLETKCAGFLPQLISAGGIYHYAVGRSYKPIMNHGDRSSSRQTFYQPLSRASLTGLAALMWVSRFEKQVSVGTKIRKSRILRGSGQ